MHALTRAALVARTSLRLGIGNVAAVAAHRAKGRLGLDRPAQAPDLPPGPMFHSERRVQAPDVADRDRTLRRAARIGGGELEIFGDRWVRLGFPYRWHDNVLPVSASGRDIKGIWEASRFGWAVDLARAQRLSPNAGFLAVLEANVDDWLAAHTKWNGDNWSCGQEASIRVLHLLLAQFVLSGTAALTPRLEALLARHLRRIEPTLGYAVAQQNNHATSEAAALFVGGSILGNNGGYGEEARRWRDLGRGTLERVVNELVMPDGGFAQYSVNYHRLMLDTLSQVEFWRRRLNQPPFSTRYLERCRTATNWLGAVTNANNGAAPNLGHNDGAQAYRLTNAAFGDHRPSLSLAACLFMDASPPPSLTREPLGWLGLEEPLGSAEHLLAKTSRMFPDWGLALINPDRAGRGAYAFVRYPVRGFRPAQADMLHFDMWDGHGRNLLVDAGSFSYADDEGNERFAAITAHNTVAFDGGEPMRRIGRFLYADWPHANADDTVAQRHRQASWAAAYTDYRGMTHKRRIDAGPAQWTITDSVAGFSRGACLRWHLPFQPFEALATGIETEALRISVSSSSPICLRIEGGSFSRTYGAKEPTLVLAVDCPVGAEELTTTVTLKD